MEHPRRSVMSSPTVVRGMTFPRGLALALVMTAATGVAITTTATANVGVAGHAAGMLLHLSGELIGLPALLEQEEGAATEE